MPSAPDLPAAVQSNPADVQTPTATPAPKKKSRRKSTGDAILTKPWEQAAVEAEQKALVKSLTDQGRYDAALIAAKSYYNIVQLNETKQAIEALANALAKVRDPATVSQFRDQQLSPEKLAFMAPTADPTDLSPATDAASQPSDILASDNVFKSIIVDATLYESAVQKFRSHTDSMDNQIGAGNLLLLADRPAEAKACFELALQLATKGTGGKTREVRDSLEGIARSIRDQDGCVAPADAFVLSMQQRATTQPSTDANPSPMAATGAMRTAITELKLSGIGNQPQSIAIQSPEDPAAQAAADPAVSAWLTEWRSTIRAGGEISPDRRAALHDILEQAKLPCLTLIDIGRAVSFQSKDELTAATFYAAASYAADDELDEFEPGANDARPILVALNSTKPLLWRVVDEGHREFVDALYILNNNLATRISPGDQSLSNERIHGYIGSAECLYVMGKAAQAASASMAIDTDRATPEQQVAIAWIRGISMLSAHRYADAKPELQIVADHPTFRYATDAFKGLAIARAYTGDSAGADVALDNWIRRTHPAVRDVAVLLAILNSAQNPTYVGTPADFTLWAAK